MLAQIKAAGAILAGGLHPEIKAQYFRIGHMGVVSPSDILATIGAVETGLAQAGYSFEPGAGLAAAQKALLSKVRDTIMYQSKQRYNTDHTQDISSKRCAEIVGAGQRAARRRGAGALSPTTRRWASRRSRGRRPSHLDAAGERDFQAGPRERIPVTPRGGGYGLSGGAVAVHGGIVLSLAKMNRILEIDHENLMVTVEPGVITGDSTARSRPRGSFTRPTRPASTRAPSAATSPKAPAGRAPSSMA